MFSDMTSHHISHLYIGRQVIVTERNVTRNFRMLCHVGVYDRGQSDAMNLLDTQAYACH
jgi:hypothetical protein